MQTQTHTIYIETYGCQMNLSDTQVIQKIMLDSKFTLAETIDEADVILLNTCSVRDNAEEKIHNRIETLFHIIKKRKTKSILGIVGCMAERLQEKLISTDNVVSLVVGPDEYRKLPELIQLAFQGEKKVAVNLNSTEDYNDIIPFRTTGMSAWVSIMRGCNNFCSYCVVPYTRGRERSRPAQTIIDEIKMLHAKGFKEVTLLGQNVNSYRYENLVQENFNNNVSYRNEKNILFYNLLEKVAQAVPNMRIRFLTSHPMDMSIELIKTIANYDNICNYIHLPIQSGSNRILNLMNRKYTVEHYLNLISAIKNNIPDCSISTDIIAGYPSETLEDHNDTLEIMRNVRYSNAFMFRYSPREGTKSFKENDDVPEEEKIRRLNEIIHLQNKISTEENAKEIGKEVEILVEGTSKKRENEWLGKTKNYKLVIFDNSNKKTNIGDLINVEITKTTSATLFGQAKY